MLSVANKGTINIFFELPVALQSHSCYVSTFHLPQPPHYKASVPVGRQGCDGGGRLGRKDPGQAVKNDDDDTEGLEHQQVVAEPHQVIHNTYNRQSN